MGKHRDPHFFTNNLFIYFFVFLVNVLLCIGMYKAGVSYFLLAAYCLIMYYLSEEHPQVGYWVTYVLTLIAILYFIFLPDL